MRNSCPQPSGYPKAPLPATVPWMNYDFTDLRLFLHVVDAGSITRGAQRAHLALATASARITSMERALGARLLIRQRRGVTPSPAGWVLVSHARQVLAELARMDAELTPFADGMSSAVVVMANTSATETFVSAAATEFLMHHPEIDIVVKELPPQQIVESVTNGHADLGLIGDAVDVGQLETATIRPDPLVVIACNGHAVAGRTQISFSECLSHPFVGYAEGRPLEEHLIGRSQPLGLRPRYRARLPSSEDICRAVAAGVGIAVLPALVADRWRRALDFAMIPISNSWARRNLILCSRRRTELSEQTLAIVSHLLRAGAEQDALQPGGA